MERYEQVEGGSAKFWEVSVEGVTLTVRFGRIGTQGQTKNKDFASAEAAAKEKEKLVKEKTKKGYALAATGRAAPRPKADASAAPVGERTPSADAVTISAATDSSPADPVPVAPPSDELEAILSHALPTRSRPGGRLDGPAAWAEFRRALLAILPRAESKPDAVEWLEARLGETSPRPARRKTAGATSQAGADTLTTLDAAEASAWISKITVVGNARLPDNWRVKSPQKTELRACLRSFAHWLVASAGALTAVDVAKRLYQANAKKRNSYEASSWSTLLDLALRAAIVTAPDKDYAAAVEFCAQVCRSDPDWRLRAYFAFILADDRPTRHELQPLAVLEDAAAAGEDVASLLWMLPLVVDAQPSAAARWRAKRSYFLYMVYCEIEIAEAAATLVAVARRHDEPALPALDWLLHYANDGERTEVARIILATDEDGALATLLPHLHEKWIRAALDEATEAHPARTLRQCLGALAAGRTEPAVKARVMEAIRRHEPDTLREWAGADAKALTHLDRLLSAGDVAIAEEESLPAVLRDPPWRKKKAKAGDDAILDVTPIPTPFAYTPQGDGRAVMSPWRRSQARVLKSMKELPAAIAKIEAEPKQDWREIPEPSTAAPKAGATEDAMLAWIDARLTEIYRARSYAIRYSGWNALYAGIEQQPDALALTLWECAGPMLARYHWAEIFPDMLARFGERALPGLLKQLEADPLAVLDAAQGVDAGEIAPHAARALFKLKKARVHAIDWLRRHRRTAILRLIPDAVGKPGPARDAAEHALRWFAANAADGRAEIESFAQQYAKSEPGTPEAVAQVLDRDPLARFPAKISKLPVWFAPGAVARPELRDGGALPDEAITALTEMLSFSAPDAVYAGVDLVRQACTPQSLSAFAWDLFSAWLAAGAPSKDGWAMRAVGWVGDDECARRLTRLIRKWPGEAAHARAVTGLDVLVDIGSDVALMNLNGIAEKLKFKGLQEKAREKIAALAEARDLTPEELSDRLAPDLDLDERGGLDIDFGTRCFRAGFDEFLKPWVKDATGQRLKDLPKPNKSDDPELAAAATARWKALKKDARAVASLQIARLENMLSTSRRVKPDVFWTFFAAHPLIRHLAQRLVWGVYDDHDPRTAPTTIFRVSDDLSLTDANDDMLTLDVSGEAPGAVGLVHPLHLPEGGLDAWGALFGDYEISQPFPQLGRETYAFTDEEKNASAIDRFDQIQVEATRLRGMGARGWALGAPQDAGCIWWIERRVRFMDGFVTTATLEFGDGLFTGAAEFEDKVQTLRKLSLLDPYQRPSPTDRKFGELDPVTASELLRGLSLLAETRVA